MPTAYKLKKKVSPNQFLCNLCRNKTLERVKIFFCYDSP